MSVLPSLPAGAMPSPSMQPDVAPSTTIADTAIDGSPASRPGDAAPPATSDGAPIFSTDPLA